MSAEDLISLASFFLEYLDLVTLGMRHYFTCDKSSLYGRLTNYNTFIIVNQQNLIKTH